MTTNSARQGLGRSYYKILVGVAIFSTMLGCQQNYNSNLPAPTVRPARRPNRTAIPVPQYTPRRDNVRNSTVPAGWTPPRRVEEVNRWRGVVIHHSADETGDATDFHRVHKKRGWDGLGYHFVINNGSNNHGKSDGEVEVGYRWRQQKKGAHCRAQPYDDNYWNEHTVGICLVGNFEKHHPTEAQWRSLVRLIRFLQSRYPIPTNEIIGHRDVKPTKCPGKYFTFSELRRRLGN